MYIYYISRKVSSSKISAMGKSFVFLLITLSNVCSQDVSNNYFSLERSDELFAAKIYKQLAEQKHNLLISPISMHAILALTQTGAEGKTLEEMAQVLELPVNKSDVLHVFENLQQKKRKFSPVSLIASNKLYVRDDVKLSPLFRKGAGTFNADVESIDVSHGEKVVREVNHWIENVTNGKIHDVVTREDINVDTVMLLINALYFKGNWDHLFDHHLTRVQKFHAANGKEVPVDLMFTQAYFGVAHDDVLRATFLELPYEDEDFAFTAVLPDDQAGLDLLAANIEKVLEPRKDIELHEVKVSLPRFRIESTVPFKELLQQLGMKEAFEDNANFTSLTESKRQVKISKILQKTFINLNEDGTEAAASSYVLIIDRIFNRPKVFLADHPFLFFIRQKSTGILLFLGHFTGVE